VRWSRATRDRCYANSRQGNGGMPEPLQVLGNRSGAAHARQWMHRPQQGQVMKAFEPVALRLQHLAESDRERRRHITVVGSPGGTHHNRDGRCSFGFKLSQHALVK